jgi:hypothetical protein
VKKMYHLVKWQKICKSKQKGGQKFEENECKPIMQMVVGSGERRWHLARHSTP